MEDLGENLPREDKNTTETTRSDIVKREEQAWSKILGTEITIPPPPDYVTPAIQARLHNEGFGIFYIPPFLDSSVDTQESLKTKGPGQFSRDVIKKFPAVRNHSDLTSYGDLADPSIPRGLNSWFWEAVYKGDIPFPSDASEGKWVAVETLPKATTFRQDGTQVEQYADTLFSRRLYQTTVFSPKLDKGPRWDNRFNIPPNAIDRGLKETSDNFFKDMDLAELHGVADPSQVIRLLTAPEYNLLGNRETDFVNPPGNLTRSQELTSTPWRGYGRVVVGLDGDAGQANFVVKDTTNTGFRAAIILK